jgi:hypothetical protein
MTSLKPWRWGALALVSAVMLAGCEGENLFDSDQNPFLEPRVSVSAPSGAFAGDTIAISVSAFAATNVSRIDVSVRGAASKDTTISTPATQNASAVVKIALPEFLTDTLIYVAAQAADAQGRVSKVRADTMVVVGPPAFVNLAGDDSASAGSTYTLRVRAFGSRPITQLQFTVRGAATKDTLMNIVPPQNDVTRDLVVNIPATPNDTVLRVSMVARDASGFSSGTVAVNIPLRVSAGSVPQITSVTATPNPARPGGIVDVRASATGVRPITRMTFRFRGAVNRDEVVVVNPARTSATVDAQVTLPAEVADTTLTITVVAEDALANLSAITTTATTVIRVSDITAPTVTAAANPGTASAGRTVQVRVNARDNVALSRIGFAAVNPAGDTIGLSPTLVNTSGVSKDTVFTFLIPTTLTPRTLRILGIAVDASGRRGISTAANLIVADSSAPTITINAPAQNATVPLQDSVRVNVRIQDPTGIRTIRFQGQATRVDSLGPTRVVDRFQEKSITFNAPLPRDTTITRYLLATSDTASEAVDIVVSATDSLGNTARSSQVILVGGPRVEMRNPINNSQVVVGGNLLLTAFAIDRSSGIDSVKINLTGAQTQTYSFRPNSPDSAVLNQNHTVGATTGILTIQAVAWNRNRISGSSNPVSVQIVAVAAADTARPQVSLSIQAPANNRVESDDSITVTVRAGDVGTSGLARVGIAVIATPDTASVVADTLYKYVNFGTPQSGTIDQTFRFSLTEFESAPGVQRYGPMQNLIFPRQFTLAVHAFAIDAATTPNCGASVTTTPASLVCVVAPQDPNARLASNVQGQQLVVTVTGGSSVRLPTGGSIADALVDVSRRRLYLSNISQSKLDVLDIATNSFVPTGAAAGGRGLVGSAPWGLAFTPANDTLVVANSGGTTISKVPLGTADDLRETVARRVFTPNTVLYEILLAVNAGRARYTQEFYDFSDRPQFVAVRNDNLLVYSTTPTGAAPDGTIRYVDPNPDPAVTTEQPEVKLLFNEGAVRPLADAYAIANVDSVRIIPGGPNANDQVTIYDHISGYPDDPARVISATSDDISAIATALRAAGSDIFIGAGRWQLEGVGMSDTTFVAISPDRSTIAFGEGATAGEGRIILCCTTSVGPSGLSVGISAQVAVSDLINNASERVLGVGLGGPGADGTILGVARGSQSTYFFDRNLRLQGLFSQGVAGGAGGAALHPNQTGRIEPTPSEALAFVATANRSIKILDTVHFYQRGEIPIRDNIAGPLRATLPFAGENGALAANDPNFILVKLFGVTDTGAVVVVNVRNKDLTQ